MPKVVAFDIIETVFSLESLRDRLVALGLPDLATTALAGAPFDLAGTACRTSALSS